VAGRTVGQRLGTGQSSGAGVTAAAGPLA